MPTLWEHAHEREKGDLRSRAAVTGAGSRLVLIVDDDHDLRESLKDVLQDEGYDVAVAEDGEAALRLLRESARPSLILLDWMMPRLGGAGFRSAQLADPELAPIPVVLLTADGRVDAKLEELQVDEHLPKPVGLDRLLSTVARYMK